jgi:hypothetical protein
VQAHAVSAASGEPPPRDVVAALEPVVAALYA